jgi:DNA-binding MarR family transcriptional regulator
MSYANYMPESTDASLPMELRNAVMRMSRRLRSERADTEVTDGQFSVLAYLFRNGPHTPNELAAWEHVSPPSMNRTVNCLEESGYAARSPSESDGRKVLVALTDAGHELVQETRRRRDAWLQRRLDRLTDDQRRVLGEAASIVADILA